MAVKLESETIELSDDELNYAESIIKDFKRMTDKYRSFYITLFQNKDNRKVCFKFTGGSLKKATIDKIDNEED